MSNKLSYEKDAIIYVAHTIETKRRDYNDTVAIEWLQQQFKYYERPIYASKEYA